MLLRLFSPLLVALALGGCGAAHDEGANGRLSVVATTGQVADIARNVGGRRVDVETILPPQTDPHSYEPRPSDAAALADADVVLQSGGDVDAWLDDLVGSASPNVRNVTLLDRVRPRTADPHWWLDPRRAEPATEAIRQALSKADPAGRDRYRAAAARYIDRLRRADSRIAACLERLPPDERRIVTTHDALRTFGERYGLDAGESVLPSLASEAQASVKDVNALVDDVSAARIEAIFPEAALSDKLERAVARDAGTTIGAPLFTDSLGAAGTPAATYLGSLRENARRIALGLSGGKLRCFEGGRDSL